ncbi:MAG: excisionase family DNA-binding protein [Bacteroidetes bacterium]|nr:excisionase family DNA-binding protein [Bacteroidota bacterium]
MPFPADRDAKGVPSGPQALDETINRLEALALRLERLVSLAGRDGGVEGDLSLDAAASSLGISTRTLRRRIESGLIAATREGALLRIPRPELERYKAARTTSNAHKKNKLKKPS